MPLKIARGQTLGDYQIDQVLGQGGMAIVYLGQDRTTHEAVAIKFLNLDALPAQIAEQAARRFDLEARQLSRLRHPHIVRIRATGFHEQVPYLVMDYLPGGTLKDRLGVALSWSDAVRLVRPLADALELAHQRGVIHRDVKPANVLLTSEGTPVLSDFGIAKTVGDGQTTLGATLTATGAVVGTPDYMAPELTRGSEFDQRVDVYALGIVLYELVTGRRPFTADTPIQVLVKHVTEPLPSPRQYVRDLPRPVEAVIVRALAKRPEDRYPTMAAFGQALDRLTNPAPRRLLPVAGWIGAAWLGLAGTVVVLALTALVFWLSTALVRTPSATPSAVEAATASAATPTVAVAATDQTPQGLPTRAPVTTPTRPIATATSSTSPTNTEAIPPTPLPTTAPRVSTPTAPAVPASSTPIPVASPTVPPVATVAPTDTSAPPPVDTSAPPPPTETSAPPPPG